MALLERPVGTIYTVGTGCSLKYSSPGKFRQPTPPHKKKRKCEYVLIKRKAQKPRVRRFSGG